MKPERNEQLIAKRKSSNFTQEEVAKAVGISHRSYQHLEAGTQTPNVDTAISIAEFLKSNVHNLFGPRRQSRKDYTHTNSTTDKEAVKSRKIPAVAAAELSEVPPSIMVKAALDLQDGRADTGEGRRVLELSRAVCGPALR
jgi:DNA-binding XRE family transcriptional regulator